jgi:ribosomal RNA assembly protein
MSFDKSMAIPLDRVGVLVGRNGKVKAYVEEKCGVVLSVDSSTGNIMMRSNKPLLEMQPFKAVEVITAIANGFSPERAFRLLDEEFVLDIVDLREYVGRSENALTRIKGRVIGLKGKTRKIIEELTNVSVYGHKVTIIGKTDDAKRAREAVEMLASGSPHRSVYKTMQKARTKAKLEMLKLWEEEPRG